MSNIRCDLCNSSDYEEVYSPVGTKRNNRVCICHNCGLVFSIHDDVPYSREPTVSCDADWGNVRFCKGQRFDVLRPDMPDKCNTCFGCWFKSWSFCSVDAVSQPDSRDCST